MGIEVQNLRMKVESLSSRLDFSERRVRALEGVVQYRPEAVRGPERSVEDDHVAPQAAAPAGSIEGFVPAGGPQGQGDGSGKRRRRRRRGRRGQGAFGASGASGAFGAQGAQGAQGEQGAQGAQDEQGAGPQDADTYEAGENGAEDGDDFENGDEMSSASAPDDSSELRRDKPEPVEEAQAAPVASASAPEESNELRRDTPEAPQTSELPEVPAVPETLKTPEPGDDDLQ